MDAVAARARPPTQASGAAAAATVTAAAAGAAATTAAGNASTAAQRFWRRKTLLAALLALRVAARRRERHCANAAAWAHRRVARQVLVRWWAVAVEASTCRAAVAARHAGARRLPLQPPQLAAGDLRTLLIAWAARCSQRRRVVRQIAQARSFHDFWVFSKVLQALATRRCQQHRKLFCTALARSRCRVVVLATALRVLHRTFEARAALRDRTRLAAASNARRVKRCLMRAWSSGAQAANSIRRNAVVHMAAWERCQTQRAVRASAVAWCEHVQTVRAQLRDARASALRWLLRR